MINQEQPGTALTAFLSAAKGYQIDIIRRDSSGGGAKVMMVFLRTREMRFDTGEIA